MMRYLFIAGAGVGGGSGRLLDSHDAVLRRSLCPAGGVDLIAVPDRNIFTIMFSYPLTWVITTILFAVYYLKYSRLKVERKIPEDKGESLHTKRNLRIDKPE